RLTATRYPRYPQAQSHGPQRPLRATSRQSATRKLAVPSCLDLEPEPSSGVWDFRFRRARAYSHSRLAHAVSASNRLDHTALSGPFAPRAAPRWSTTCFWRWRRRRAWTRCPYDSRWGPREGATSTASNQTHRAILLHVLGAAAAGLGSAYRGTGL